MNPTQCRIALRPRNALDVFDLGMRFVRESWRPLLTLGVLTVVPLWLMLSLAAWLLEGHWAVLLAALLLGTVLQPAFTVLTGRLLFVERVSMVEVAKDLFQRVWGLLGLVGGLLATMLVGSVTCGVGLPWALVALLYLPESLLLEQVSLSRGMRRAGSLALGQPIAAVVGASARLWLLLLGAGLGETMGQALVAFVFQLGEPFGSAMDFQVTPYLLFGVLAAQPVFAIYRLLLYLDARTRLEGWDLQVGLWAAGADS